MEQIKHRSFELISIKPEEQREIIKIITNVKNSKFVISECLQDIRNYDIDTYIHSIEVAILSLFIGRKLELEADQLEDLALSALLHDYGKTKVPIEIIDKPGKIDIVEREIIEAHTALGAYYLRQYGFSNEIIRGVYEHHESYLGSERGYPRHLMQEEIHLFGRIIAIADKMDAYTSKRVYHHERSVQQLKEFIINNEDLDSNLTSKIIPYIIEKDAVNHKYTHEIVMKKEPKKVRKSIAKIKKGRIRK